MLLFLEVIRPNVNVNMVNTMTQGVLAAKIVMPHVKHVLVQPNLIVIHVILHMSSLGSSVFSVLTTTVLSVNQMSV